MDENKVPRAEFIIERTNLDKTCYAYKCNGCKTTFSYPRYTDLQMNAIYRDYRSDAYDQARARHEFEYEPHEPECEDCVRVLRAAEYLLLPYLKEPRILDVGGFDGLSTPLRHIASTHHVLDPAEHELKAGIKVSLPEPPYDLVVMANILEHVSEPLEFVLDWIQHSCKMVYVEVPHASLRNLPSHIHEHQTFFTISGIVMLLQRAKLKVLDLKIRNGQILVAARR